MKSAGRFGAGLVVGALIAGLMLALWSPNGRDDAAATTSTTVPPGSTIAAEPFLEPGEVLIGSTAILPRGLDVEDGVAFFRYELAGLSPSMRAEDDAEYQGDVLMMPEDWVLTTTAGVTIAGSTGPRDQSLRFELPSADDTVSRIDLVGWRVAVPFGERAELVIEPGATASFRSGEAVIETVLEQSISTIVQIDFDAEPDPWVNGFLRPVEPGWRVTGRQGGGVQLIWDGQDAPDRVTLEDVGFAMRPRSGEVVVIAEPPQ